MAKIHILTVKRDATDFTVHFELTVPQTVEGQPREVPIGEAAMKFAADSTIEQIKAEILRAAKGIIVKHREAKAKREALEAIEFPDIEE